MFEFRRRFQTDDNRVLKPLLFGDGFPLRHTKSLCNFNRTVGELHFFFCLALRIFFVFSVVGSTLSVCKLEINRGIEIAYYHSVAIH